MWPFGALLKHLKTEENTQYIKLNEKKRHKIKSPVELYNFVITCYNQYLLSTFFVCFWQALPRYLDILVRR